MCDEPVSSLDVPSQVQVVELLAALKRESGLCLLFVSHNLAVVRRLCERVLVLYLGRMMELAATATVYAQPRHPYTRELLAAIPLPDPARQPARLGAVRPGRGPIAACTRPPGASTAPAARTRSPCVPQQLPTWEDAAPGEYVACHRWREIAAP